jgi:hypothetical protein
MPSRTLAIRLFTPSEWNLSIPNAAFCPRSRQLLPVARMRFWLLPAINTLLFENSDVRVLGVHLPPHIREPMHTYPWPGVLYILQGVPTLNHTLGVSAPPVQNPPPGL